MPSRGPLRRAVLALLAAGLAFGCQWPDGSDDAGTGDEAGATGSDTGDIGDPAFLNPALGEFTVVSTQHVPKDIVVHKIALGNTQLIVDGQTAGTLGPGSALGELTGDRLRLFFHGALTPGTHTIQLASSAPDGPRFSTRLTMLVAAPQQVPPHLRVDLEPEPRDGGDALILGGSGPDALLGLLAAGPDPALRLYRRDGDGWTDLPVAETTLEGHVLKDMHLGTPVAILARPPIPGSDIAVVRVAYRRGHPGAAILTRDLTIFPEPAAGPLETAIDLSAALFADAEFAALGRPFFLDDALVAEFLAAADSEIPHPGDRGLALVRRRGGGWSQPERVPTPGPLDLDAAGPALSLAALPLSSGLSVRIGQHQAGLLRLSAAGAPLLTRAGDDIALPLGDPAVLATITSSFGARTIAAVTHDRVALNFLGTTGDVKNRDANVPTGDLPDAPISAPAAPGVLLGYSAFLVPYGDAAPVHAVLGDGDRVFVLALTDPEPLFCRHVALMPSLAGNDDAAPALTLACIDGDGLRIGVLRAEPVVL